MALTENSKLIFCSHFVTDANNPYSIGCRPAHLEIHTVKELNNFLISYGDGSVTYTDIFWLEAVCFGFLILMFAVMIGMKR